MDHDDARLVAELQKRDAIAFAKIYDRYVQTVYSLFLRITRQETAAEDLVQELFMRVWNRARDFDATKGSLGAWILSIARNMAIDYVRSADARFAARLRPLDQLGPMLSGELGDPESVLDQARAINAAFAELNPNQKRVLELAYFDGFSQTEIAARLNEPLGTVKSWMRSALTRLRAAIKRSAVL